MCIAAYHCIPFYSFYALLWVLCHPLSSAFVGLNYFFGNYLFVRTFLGLLMSFVSQWLSLVVRLVVSTVKKNVGWKNCAQLDHSGPRCALGMRSAYPNKISNLGGAFFRAISTVYLSHLDCIKFTVYDINLYFRTCCACTCKDYVCRHAQPKWHCHFSSLA